MTNWLMFYSTYFNKTNQEQLTPYVILSHTHCYLPAGNRINIYKTQRSVRFKVVWCSSSESSDFHLRNWWCGLGRKLKLIISFPSARFAGEAPHFYVDVAMIWPTRPCYSTSCIILHPLRLFYCCLGIHYIILLIVMNIEH